METKILVTGAGGGLGSALSELALSRGLSWTFLSHHQLDITNPEQVASCLNQEKPTYLINAAAFTNVDLAQTQPQQAYALNAAALEILAQTCEKTHTVLLHISTDYVFDGKDASRPDGLRNRPYEPTDAVNPLGIYGKSKLLGEQHVLAYSRGVVVRTSWIYSHLAVSRNFLSAIPRLLATKDTPLTVESQQQNAPTYAPHLAQALLSMVEQGVESGLYHGCGQGGCTRLAFAQRVREAMIQGKCPAWKAAKEPVSVLPMEDTGAAGGQLTGAPRPIYSVMSNRSLVELIGRPVPTWEEAIEEFLWKIQL